VEAFASSRVAQLAPVADEVMRSGRIEVLAVAGEWVELNGYAGSRRDQLYSEWSSTRTSLDDVLRTEGISRAEFDRLTAALRGAGVERVLAKPGHVSFRFGQDGSTYLVYARPGQPLAATGDYLERTTLRRTPLGDGWYLLRR
jgi:molybdopterin biosynthesis enzyme